MNAARTISDFSGRDTMYRWSPTEIPLYLPDPERIRDSTSSGTDFTGHVYPRKAGFEAAKNLSAFDASYER